MTNPRSHLDGKRPAKQSGFEQTSIRKAVQSKPIGDDGHDYHLELIRLTRCAWGITERIE